MRMYYVYILASGKYGTLYIGVTNNLLRRTLEHKDKTIPGFTEKHHVTQLVYFEETPDVFAALTREKQLKRWNRLWKIRLINRLNPLWEDLFEKYNTGSPPARG